MKKMSVAETIWQDAGWYRAVTLSERRGSFQACIDAPMEHGTWNIEKAEQTLQQWKTQPSYKKGMSFADRLAVDSLTESDLLMLLTEPSESLQARLSPPDWLLELQTAFEDFSGCADWSLPPVTDSKPALAFLNAIQPLLKQGIHHLVTGIHNLAQEYEHLPFEQHTIVSSLFANLAQPLLSKLDRTFVLEMRVARTSGRLQGATPEARFQNFVQQLSVPEGVLPLLEEYAVLTRQLIGMIDQWVTFSLEVLRHVCVDWEQICALFTPQADPGLLVEIRAGAGDTHRNGRSVTTLRFQAGLQLIYKPRSLAIDLHFQELLLWLNARGSHPPFQTFNMIDQGTYGWSAFIEAQACQSEEEVQRFYERQGAYLALLRSLYGSDLHAENIIAMGEHPMLIDLEALFHPHIGVEDLLFGGEPAFVALHHSVMRVGLLPHYVWGDEDTKGVNIAGLGGEAGQMTPRALPKWEDAGTDQMRLVRARIEMATCKNRPTLKGQPVDVLNYQEHILAGFNTMYQTLLNHRDALLVEMLPRFAQDEIRFIARPTDIYWRFLYDSFRPELLRDALERERHFDRLWIGIEWQPYMARIIPAERIDLLRGDVPFFTTRPGSRDLLTSQGEVVPAFFTQTSMDLVRKRVQQLDEQDRTRQLWVINASFTCVARETRHAFAQSCSSQPRQSALTCSHWLAAARTIGDELCQRAVHDQDAAGWLGICQVREHEWKVQAAGLDLYNGLPGIILFLAYLAELSGEARYLKLARAALRNIQALLQHSQRQQLLPCIGAFDGWGGLIYLFTHLGALWDESALFREAEKLVALLPGLIEQDTAFDIMAGSAGCIAALLSLHAARPSTRILETAIACGDHLLAHARPMSVGVGWQLQQQDVPLTGMAHGNAGIALSLLRLAERSGLERFRQAALAAIAYEHSLFSPEQQNWPDLRKSHGSDRLNQPDAQEGEHFLVAWCHGAPGIALSRMASLGYVADTTLYDEIEYALATTSAASEKPGIDPTLCHGAAGLLETLLTARQELGQHDYTPHLERLAHQLLDFLEATTSQKGSQVTPWWMEAPGFMMGLAGIGYTFLRIAEPLRVPSVLTLAEPCFQPAFRL